jgi:uncharacterized protein (DUF2147 family)
MKALSKVLLIVAGVLFISQLAAQDIVGLWKTIDDKTNKPKSVIKIYKKKDGKYYGKIVKLFREPGEDPNPKCDKCSGPKHNKPILGMEILTGLKKKGPNNWDDGKILDPESGNVYDVKMWIENGKLHVRGYIGWSLIGRSQVWLPYKPNK